MTGSTSMRHTQTVQSCEELVYIQYTSSFGSGEDLDEMHYRCAITTILSELAAYGNLGSLAAP